MELRVFQINTMSVSISLLDDIASQLQGQGKELDSLKFVERSLVMRQEFFGGGIEVEKLAEQFVIRCNLIAMKFLKEEDFVLSFEFLKKAEWSLGDRSGFLSNRPLLKLKLLAATWNNFGCFFKSRGKLQQSLQYLEKAVKAEEALYEKHEELKDKNILSNSFSRSGSISVYSDHSIKTNSDVNIYNQKNSNQLQNDIQNQIQTPADENALVVQSAQNLVNDATSVSLDTSATTHLNICAVLSQLGKHRKALNHAKSALKCLDQEERNQRNYFRDDDIGLKKWLEQRDASVKAVVYYNLAVELEFLNDYHESKNYYRRSYFEAKKSLGLSHPTTQVIRSSYINAFGEPPPAIYIPTRDSLNRRSSLMNGTSLLGSHSSRSMHSVKDSEASSLKNKQHSSTSRVEKRHTSSNNQSRRNSIELPSIKSKDKRNNENQKKNTIKTESKSKKYQHPPLKTQLSSRSLRSEISTSTQEKIPPEISSIQGSSRSESMISNVSSVRSGSLQNTENDSLKGSNRYYEKNNTKIGRRSSSSSITSNSKDKKISDERRNSVGSRNFIKLKPISHSKSKVYNKIENNISPYNEKQIIQMENKNNQDRQNGSTTPIRKFNPNRSKPNLPASPHPGMSTRRYSLLDLPKRLDPDQAAIIIQRNVRGWISRRHYKQVKALIKSYIYKLPQLEGTPPRSLESPATLRKKYMNQKDETLISPTKKTSLGDYSPSGRNTPRDLKNLIDSNGRPLSRQSSRNEILTPISTQTNMISILGESEFLYDNEFQEEQVTSPAVISHLKNISVTLENLQKSLSTESDFLNSPSTPSTPSTHINTEETIPNSSNYNKYNNVTLNHDYDLSNEILSEEDEDTSKNHSFHNSGYDLQESDLEVISNH